MGWLAKRVLGIGPMETTVARRGFRVTDRDAVERIESIGRSFAFGYNTALESEHESELVPELEQLDPALRGFAYEGAGMAMALLDRLTPWRRDRVARFLSGAGESHAYLIHVGVGWALARWPGRIEPILDTLDPFLLPLAFDGYGFHEGFFHWNRYSQNQTPPLRVGGEVCQAFDQGLGRSLWFVEGGSVSRIEQAIQRLSSSRHADLWSGIGLASVYAGELNDLQLRELLRVCGKHHASLSQGAAFAAKARLRGKNATAYTDHACRILCGMSASEAADLTDTALQALGDPSHPSDYELWRVRIQEHFQASVPTCPLIP